MVNLAAHRPQKLYDHIRELRARLVNSGLVFLIGATIAYIFKQRLLEFLQRPMHGTLYYTTPAGAFNFVMKICFVTGLGLALPAIIYNFVNFLRPAFRKSISTKVVHLVSFTSLGLALAGAAFGFLVIVPMSLHFFGRFSTAGIKPLISAGDYLNFILNCILSFMVISQLPLIVLFIDHIKPLKPRKLLKYERHVIVGSLVIALLLPFTYDPLTQFLIALPIVLLYNLSIIFVLIAHRGKVQHKTFAQMSKQLKTDKTPQPISIIDDKPQPVPADAPTYMHDIVPNKPLVRLVDDFIRPNRLVARRPVKSAVRIAAYVPPARTNFLDLRQGSSPSS